jgi:hypothetical protein
MWPGHNNTKTSGKCLRLVGFVCVCVCVCVCVDSSFALFLFCFCCVSVLCCFVSVLFLFVICQLTVDVLFPSSTTSPFKSHQLHPPLYRQCMYVAVLQFIVAAIARIRFTMTLCERLLSNAPASVSCSHELPKCSTSRHR